MEYRRLGRSGLKVSVVGLGTNQFGGPLDAQGSARVVHKALDVGINCIDTSDSYSRGVSEEHIGKALAGRRHEAIIATKVHSPMGEGPNDRGSSRQHIMDGIAASLRRLSTDYVDLYQIHRFDPDTPLEETLRALDDLVHQGKVRYIGCSNYAAWQLTHALWISDRHNLASFVAVQPHYNLFVREVERELLPACAALGVGVIPYFPLASGLLTGKYELGKAPPPDSRAGRNPNMQRQLTEENLGRVEQLKAFAQQRGCTTAQLAIAWLAAHPEVSTVIAGATKPEQVEANAGAADVHLSAEDMAAIEGMLKA